MTTKSHNHEKEIKRENQKNIPFQFIDNSHLLANCSLYSLKNFLKNKNWKKRYENDTENALELKY